MKYIRTKDGKIVDFLISKKEYEEKYPNSKVSYDRWFELVSDGYNILKQADTIEELCDELVIHNPSNDGDFYPKHFVYRNRWETMLKPMSDYQKSKGIEVYGAIWTELGLKYVAKMNDKGELELL